MRILSPQPQRCLFPANGIFYLCLSQTRVRYQNKNFEKKKQININRLVNLGIYEGITEMNYL